MSLVKALKKNVEIISLVLNRDVEWSVTGDVILVHIEKFQKLKQAVNVFACPSIMETHPDEFLFSCFLFLPSLAFT